MEDRASEFRRFFGGLLGAMFKGSAAFYVWVSLLALVVLLGLGAYVYQMREGLAVTNMREQVSWGFYISNFTFLVGVAAAAVLLIIPAYLYSFKSIKKIVVYGELMAVTAILMALMFIFVDFGRPDRAWHALPLLGSLNFPGAILAWDMLVLSGYLALNLFVILFINCHTYYGKKPNRLVVIPLILLSIPWAVGVHTVTAFVYNGLAARPFWNASILAPRFLASAFCSGPALMIIVFQVLRKLTDFKIQDRAIFKLAEMIAYAMAINLFLMFAEIFKEYYSGTTHLAPMKYLYQGLHGHGRLVPWIWTAMAMNSAGFLLFLLPKTRKRLFTLNIGCLLVFAGVWIEKGMGLIIPGFIPDALGEIYEYMPSRVEVAISSGIWAFGALAYTVLSKAVMAIDTGRLRHPGAPALPAEEEEEHLARDIMSRRIISVAPETPVEEIGKLLVSNRISGVPVVDAEGRLIGVVSESDIIFREIRHEPHLVERLGNIILPEPKEKAGNTAYDIMTSPPVTAGENTPLRELTQLITERKIKRIIIVDSEGRPAGIVSRIDIVKALEHI
jgi:molybdopterin-containing oxidoreductase family membrane subunit